MRISQKIKRILQCQAFVVLGVLLGLGFLIHWNSTRSPAPDSALPWNQRTSSNLLSPLNPPFSPLNHISSRFIQWWSAGYFPAAVDALWILMLSKIGTGQYHPQTLGEMTRFYQLATELDPDFFELYDQAGVLFCFFYESPESAELILTRGIEHFESGSVPQAFWRRAFALYMHLAYAQAFLAQDWAKAKQTYIRAAGVPHAPAFLGHFRSWLEQEGSEKKLAIRVLRLLVQTTQDEKIREKYREKLKQYES